jgi:hypothetical protein
LERVGIGWEGEVSSLYVGTAPVRERGRSSRAEGAALRLRASPAPVSRDSFGVASAFRLSSALRSSSAKVPLVIARTAWLLSMSSIASQHTPQQRLNSRRLASQALGAGAESALRGAAAAASFRQPLRRTPGPRCIQRTQESKAGRPRGLQGAGSNPRRDTAALPVRGAQPVCAQELWGVRGRMPRRGAQAVYESTQGSARRRQRKAWQQCAQLTAARHQRDVTALGRHRTPAAAPCGRGIGAAASDFSPQRSLRARRARSAAGVPALLPCLAEAACAASSRSARRPRRQRAAHAATPPPSHTKSRPISLRAPPTLAPTCTPTPQSTRLPSHAGRCSAPRTSPRTLAARTPDKDLVAPASRYRSGILQSSASRSRPLPLDPALLPSFWSPELSVEALSTPL